MYIYIIYRHTQFGRWQTSRDVRAYTRSGCVFRRRRGWERGCRFSDAKRKRPVGGGGAVGYGKTRCGHDVFMFFFFFLCSGNRVCGLQPCVVHRRSPPFPGTFFPRPRFFAIQIIRVFFFLSYTYTFTHAHTHTHVLFITKRARVLLFLLLNNLTDQNLWVHTIHIYINTLTVLLLSMILQWRTENK